MGEAATVRRIAVPTLVSLTCVLLGLLSLGASYATIFEQEVTSTPTTLWIFGDLLTGLVAAVAVGPIRDRWVGNLLLVALMPWSAMGFVAGLVALYRFGKQQRWRSAAAAGGYVLASSVVQNEFLNEILAQPPQDWYVVLVAALLMVVPALLLGHLRGTRTALVTSLRHQAAAAEQERLAVIREHEARLTQVRAEERTAIAREMHDSLSHHLSILAVTAGALAHRDDLTPERSREAAGVIRNAAGVANAELRDVLLALRSNEPEAGPVASQIAIEDLVERARQAGKQVSVTWSQVTPEEIDAGPRTAAFAIRRITGELVANIGKYAVGPAELHIAHRDGTLRIRTRNPVDPHSQTGVLGTGTGLVGLTERARLLGGDATAGTEGGWFEVEAWFPWEK